ncbi:MAG: hypothetical protein AB7F64_04600 [Gammaproteobacteria bacterium]
MFRATVRPLCTKTITRSTLNKLLKSEQPTSTSNVTPTTPESSQKNRDKQRLSFLHTSQPEKIDPALLDRLEFPESELSALDAESTKLLKP